MFTDCFGPYTMKCPTVDLNVVNVYDEAWSSWIESKIKDREFRKRLKELDDEDAVVAPKPASDETTAVNDDDESWSAWMARQLTDPEFRKWFDSDEGAATGTEASVCADIAMRQASGVSKYKTTVAGNPLSLREWLQHAYEECLDQAVYLKRAIEELDANAK